jgi:hypothetical protein
MNFEAKGKRSGARIGKSCLEGRRWAEPQSSAVCES